MLIYLLGYGSRALLILRRDPRSRRIANVHLFASAAGIVACAIRIITAYVAPLQAVEGGTLVWFFACTCGAGSRSPRRIPGGSRRDGSTGQPTESYQVYAEALADSVIGRLQTRPMPTTRFHTPKMASKV